MEYKSRFVFIIFVLIFQLNCSSATGTNSSSNSDTNSSTNDNYSWTASTSFLKEGTNYVWKQFWKYSCTFAQNRTRSARNIKEEIIHEIPVSREADILFQYLYPALDLKAHDFGIGGRSADSGNFLTSWLDDLTQMWEDGCSDEKYFKEDIFSKGGKESVPKKAGNSNLNENAPAKNSTQISLKNDVKNGTMGKIGKANGRKNSTKKLNGKLGKQDVTNVVAQMDLPPPFKPIDKFYSNYGGDVEYFFPLIGFGIPFNGEISLLGFHGFKGLFPYKKRK